MIKPAPNTKMDANSPEWRQWFQELQDQMTAFQKVGSVKAKVYNNSGEGSAGGWQAASLRGTSYDVGGAAWPDGWALRPPLPGYYQVNASIMAYSPTGNFYVYVGIVKNGYSGTWYGQAIGQGPQVYISASMSDVVYFNGTTDYVQLWTAFTGTSIVASPATTYLSCVGPF